MYAWCYNLLATVSYENLLGNQKNKELKNNFTALELVATWTM